MSLIVSVFPLYLMANLHCLGMCGPIAMMLHARSKKYLYLVGRSLSFTCMGLVAGSLGSIIDISVDVAYFSSWVSILFGLSLLVVVLQIHRLFLFKVFWIQKKINSMTQYFIILLNRKESSSALLVGLLTVLLPCGQSLMVFSISALSLDPVWGSLNAFAFTLITTPSLLFAMKASSFLMRYKQHSRLIMRGLMAFVGSVSILRGLSQMEIIPHLTLSDTFHIVMY